MRTLAAFPSHRGDDGNSSGISSRPTHSSHTIGDSMTYSINRRLWIGLAATWLISFSSVASGQVAFFDGITSDFNDGNNWSGLAVPGQFDLAVHNGAGINTQVLDITANANVDSFRISGSFAAPVINHTAGILTIEDTTSTADAFPDNGFWVGEFGPSVFPPTT